MHVVVNINYCIELTSILKWNRNGRSENGTSLKKCQKENSDVNEQHLGFRQFQTSGCLFDVDPHQRFMIHELRIDYVCFLGVVQRLNRPKVKLANDFCISGLLLWHPITSHHLDHAY